MTATFALSSSFGGGGGAGGGGKLTKSRVKPILKKLHSVQSAHSERNSLDLDRAWEEQPQQTGYTYNLTSSSNDEPLFAPPAGSLTTPTAVTASASSSAGQPTAAATSHHARSTSGTSHISINTTGSGRNGSFVHPFQQTPRTSTPPLLNFATSRASLDNSSYVANGTGSIVTPITPSTITESTDDVNEPFGFRKTSSNNIRSTTNLPHSHSNAYHPRRPSLASSQRTSSFSEITHTLRVATSRTSTGTAPRMSLNQPQSPDTLVPVSASSLAADTPLSSTTANSSPQMLSSVSTSAATSMSPLRNSLDMNSFRIRSRSDVDTATRQEQVRRARRKFEEKEKAKDEKYAKEQERKQERAGTKDTHRNQLRKGVPTARTSSSTFEHTVQPRKSTSTAQYNEKTTGPPTMPDFNARGYEEVSTAQAPHSRAEEVHFEPSRRAKKNGSASAWTAFVLWLRTRLLKLGRR